MKKKIGHLRYVVLLFMIVILGGMIFLAIKGSDRTDPKDTVSMDSEKDKDESIIDAEIKETTKEDMVEIPEITTGTEEFVIFGVDTRGNNLGKGTRSDSIMIVAVNHETKEIRLASIFRDCYVEIEGHGMDKINHAHSFGGPDLALQTVNRNFDLNLEKYITVNFIKVSELVDDIGGIEMDITEEETRYINGYIDEINSIEGKNSPHITEPGVYQLDGVQAVAYTRIRYTAGGDYKRAERQRTILFKIFDKAKELESASLINLVEKFMNEINTNYRTDEVVDMLYYLSKYNITDSKAYPTKLWGGKVDGIWYGVPVTLESNTTELHEYLYPEKDYTVSDTVLGISKQMEQVADIPNEILD